MVAEGLGRAMVWLLRESEIVMVDSLRMTGSPYFPSWGATRDQIPTNETTRYEILPLVAYTTDSRLWRGTLS